MLRSGIGNEIDRRTINAIRFLSIDAVQKAESGHPGAPLGIAPAAWVLWDKFLRHNPRNPEWPNRDRFVLSAGHASMLLYSLLHLTGYDVSIEELKNFRQWNSKTPGHPEYRLTPGVEVTTGPLGQGFANGVGMALAENILADTFNKPGYEVIDHMTYGIVSDGDLQEGVSSEAASLAGTLELGKIVFIYDDNGISIEGDTDITFRENVKKRFSSYGWHVTDTIDANDLVKIQSSIDEARLETRCPSLVIVKSVIGYGSPNKAGNQSAHGEALGIEEVALTRVALDWAYKPFFVPADVKRHGHKALKNGASAEQKWQTLMDKYELSYPKLADDLVNTLDGRLPQGWDVELLDQIGRLTEPMATRAVSGIALKTITKALPRVIGGSADLASSNNTLVSGRGSFQPENRQGRNLHFGVREHAMGAITNGMSAHGGVIPYAGTFLIFSDYMRGAVRVGALSNLPVIWIWTHDSIGLGEDGPTHQPIAQLMALRMIPNLTIIRPADADETLQAWRIAINNRAGPTGLILTRQSLPYLNFCGSRVAPMRFVEKGAYIIKDSEILDDLGRKKPELIIIGTGSEVQLAIKAAESLESEGISVRVVSMPSWELFEKQNKFYKQEVLPKDIRARVSVEAGTTIGWERYVGLDGAIIGIDSFGASAPGSTVLEKFGFTIENVVSRCRKVLEGLS